MRRKLILLAFLLATIGTVSQAQGEDVCWRCESCTPTTCSNCVRIICP